MFDIFVSLVGIIILLPVFALIAILIKLNSPGPIIFKQLRVGKSGVYFNIYKFRTMRQVKLKNAPLITKHNDSRITSLGVSLRKYKLDEIPQLFNVLIGNMSLVGPRPEVPKYVSYYPIQTKELILSVRPGITDPASLHYKAEGDLLMNVSDPESYYIYQLLPHKLKLMSEYVVNRSFIGDIKIIFRTAKEVLTI